MNLRSLLGVLKELTVIPETPQLEREIAHVTTDSREVRQFEAGLATHPSGAPGESGGGTVFVAIRGSKQDGHMYLPEVLQNPGTAAVVVEKATYAELLAANKITVTADTAPVIGVDDTRFALDLLARRLFYDPSHRLLCFGVTGTNGKTSTVYLLEKLLNAAKLPTGVLGTINHHLGDRVWESTHTTPEPIKLQGRLNEMKELGAQAIAMEVSSHALHQRRADGVQFNVVIFTNLTRDHLDYHGTEQDYFEAKQRLFTDLLWSSHKVPLFAIVNTDDPWGRKLRVSGKAGVFTIGENKDADFRFALKSQDFSGQEFSLATPFGEFESRLPLIGRHNLYNAVGAIAAVASLGVTIENSLPALKDFAGIPGRLQRVPDALGRFIFVDYAHTPDALENVLKTLSAIRDELPKPRPRILTLFGCGGDRDKGKRPQMAKIAADYSDLVFVTSDNPRGEDPQAILADIRLGFTEVAPEHVREDVDRARAIEQIIREAHPGDVVLIAGKGHEDYQELNGVKKPFSDVEVATSILQGRVHA